jgi:hypothetical protein
VGEYWSDGKKRKKSSLAEYAEDTDYNWSNGVREYWIVGKNE